MLRNSQRAVLDIARQICGSTAAWMLLGVGSAGCVDTLGGLRQDDERVDAGHESAGHAATATETARAAPDDRTLPTRDDPCAERACGVAPEEHDAALPDAGAGDASVSPESDGSVRARDDASLPQHPDCDAGACCAGAIALGDLNGDADSNPIVYQGHGAGFFSVIVREVDHTFLTLTALKLRAHLTSTLPQQFVIYGDQDGCSTASVVSTMGLDGVEGVTWSDTFEQDDTRAVIIEVRAASADDAAWTLTLEGNT